MIQKDCPKGSYTISRGAISRDAWDDCSGEGAETPEMAVSGLLVGPYLNPWVLVMMAGIQLADALSTVAGWEMGLTETNPKMRYLLETGGTDLYLSIKVSTGLIVSVGLAWTAQNFRPAFFAALGLGGFMLAVVVTNLVSLGWL